MRNDLDNTPTPSVPVQAKRGEGGVDGTLRYRGDVLGSVGTLERAMVEMGVLLMSPRRRKKVAERLAELGVTLDDLEEIRRYARRAASDVSKVPGYISGVLLDTDTVPDVLEGVKSFGQEERPHYWGFPVPYPGCRCEGCESARRRQGNVLNME